MDDQPTPQASQQPGLSGIDPGQQNGLVQPAPPEPAPPKPSKLPLIIVAAFLAVVLILAVAGTLAYKLHSSGKASTNASSSSSSSSSSPGFLGGNQQARDSKRKSDISSLQTQLEAYFQNYGYYPSLKDMNSASWLAANMKSLDEGALADPSSSCDPAKTGCLVAAPKANAYSYTVTDSTGKSCEADDTKCANYTLTATLETGGTFSRENLD